ncbi:MAG: DNA mismatch repair endonuclease MutL [Caldilineaceae bacterium]|nr:DNA mismatch repair endonuclease MutL [Caldilineaceae bacterium]
MTIQRLAPDVAAKIAAGEVVERPANAVKELIENSIDADATEIRVEIKEGGQRLLRVVDNGGGIPSGEIALALERHATSKVRQIEDLAHVLTFGFRGEALYSIAAVSQLTLSSRHRSEEFGAQLRAEGGQIVSQSRAGLPVGTIVNVEHLFYNVPARKKYLRQANAEAGQIRSIVQHAAIAHPNRRFSLVVDGRMVFQSTGSGDALEVLAKIYTLDEARQMIPIGKNKGDAFPIPAGDLSDEISFMDEVTYPSHQSPVTVSGYISLPTVTRANRSYIDIFVNRRPIADRNLAHAVVQAYHTFLPVGRYPLAVIFIEAPPEELDVNVHPRKSEVRFLQARQIFSDVQKVLRRAVVEHANVPGLALSHPQPILSPESGRTATVEPLWMARQSLPSSPIPEAEGQAEMELYLPPAPPVDLRSQPEAPQADEPQRNQPAAPHPMERKLPPLRVVGQVGAMYVVAEGPEGLYLIDQHAAHERIMYERFMAQRFGSGIPRQGLLEPLTLHVGDVRAGIVAEHLDELHAAGFEIDPFGGDTFLVRAMPAVLAEGDANRVLDDILQGMVHTRDLVGEELEAQLVKMVCKRASIKAGQVLSDLEMKELVRQLEECQSPRTCPHGRPTLIQLSANELEKAFKRI